jgi:hypothetical protein
METPIIIKKLTKSRKVPVKVTYLGRDLITFQIDRRNKAGDLVYPYFYQIERTRVLEYPATNGPGGRSIAIIEVPLSAFRKIGKRVELPLNGDTVEAGDPAIKEWGRYL